jgi:hypothetical protein
MLSATRFLELGSMPFIQHSWQRVCNRYSYTLFAPPKAVDLDCRRSPTILQHVVALLDYLCDCKQPGDVETFLSLLRFLKISYEFSLFRAQLPEQFPIQYMLFG